jgi:NAD-dependent aldehyde dehydrogenases
LDKKNFYIHGAWVKPNSSEEIKVIDPATEENCAVITLGNNSDVDLAVIAAKNAYESWAFSAKEERIGLLEKLSAKKEKRWADIAGALPQRWCS